MFPVKLVFEEVFFAQIALLFDDITDVQVLIGYFRAENPRTPALKVEVLDGSNAATRTNKRVLFGALSLKTDATGGFLVLLSGLNVSVALHVLLGLDKGGKFVVCLWLYFAIVICRASNKLDILVLSTAKQEPVTWGYLFSGCNKLKDEII